MASTWGENIKLSIFGGSHTEAIGVVLDNLPPNEKIDMEKIRVQMARRAPGKDKTATTRLEADEPQVLSGLFNGVTTGAPLAAIIANTNTRSKDYSDLKIHPRPGHADYTASVRYDGANDIRGGGHFSGRLTACLVFAGAVCRQILERRGITTRTMKIIPLADRVVIKTVEVEETTKGGLILTGSAKEKPQVAQVVAVGPGGVVDGKEVKMTVKVGDKVLTSKYSGTEVKVDGEECTIVRQADILAIVE